MHHVRRSRLTGPILVLTLVPGFAFAGALSSVGKRADPRPHITLTKIAESTAEPTTDAHGLKIEAAWARATPPGAKVGAGYLRIVNTTKTPDRLIGISSPAAAKVELHEMIMSGTIARMRQVVGGLEIPAGATVTLKPGSYHLMFLGLKAPFTEGERIKATLAFEKAGKVDMEFAVRGIGAGPPQDMTMH